MDSKPALVRKGRCKTRYRLYTPEEMGLLDPEPWHVMYGGRYGDRIEASPYNRSIAIYFGDESVIVSDEYYDAVVQHDWIDTDGMLRSYCKCCDARGEWDREQMAYVAIDPEPAEEPAPEQHNGIEDFNARWASMFGTSALWSATVPVIAKPGWTFPIARTLKP